MVFKTCFQIQFWYVIRLTKNIIMNFSPFARQVFAASSFQLASMSVGGSLSYSCVLLQQFKEKDSDIRPDLDTTTWIASIHGFAGIPSVLMPTIMQWKGRKFAFIISCLLLAIGWILTVAAGDARTLIVSETFSGLGCNCIVVVNFMTISEMLDPKYRSTYMVFLAINQAVGMFSTIMVGNYVHWKTVAIIMSCPLLLSLLPVFIWPESPSWLAYKGDFDECEKAFIWLRGTDEEATKELQTLIAAHKVVRRKRNSVLKEMARNVQQRDFYIPIFLMLLIISTFYVTGSISWYIYAYNIIELATGDVNIARIGYLFIDGILAIGACVCMIFLRKFNTKSIILCTGFGSIFCHLCSSMVTYLQAIGIVSRGSLLFMFTFLGYFCFCLSGFNVVCFALSTELMPVKHKGLGGAIFIISTCTLHTTTAKLLPYLLLLLNLWGTFLMSAIGGFIGLCLIWRYVPITKNRTLQEIEDYYKYGTFVRERVLDDIDVSTPIFNNKVKE